jgi:hypothetical protein
MMVAEMRKNEVHPNHYSNPPKQAPHVLFSDGAYVGYGTKNTKNASYFSNTGTSNSGNHQNSDVHTANN